jgi:hypothetical protein
MAVVDVQVGANGPLEFHGAAASAATDLPLGQGGKPALDLIEPGGGGRAEVRVKTRMASKPALHRKSCAAELRLAVSWVQLVN